MQAANLELLRVKYRKIIQAYDSQQQEIRKSTAKAGTRVLTEHCENMSNSKIKDTSSNSVFVALKERIAQGLKNITEKEQEIEGYKQQITKYKLKLSLLQSQLSENQSIIQQKNIKIAEEKVNLSTLQKEIQRLRHIIQGQCIDKQLVFKQSEFYKKEIKSLKNENKKLKIKLQQQQKEISLIQTMKNNSNRLKDNIKRMQEIINQCCQQKVKVDLTDKYYLGKPIKQSSCWVSQNLVGEVQAFLRKWKIGFNNKQFIDNLVKFIDHFPVKGNKTKSLSKPKLQKSGHKRRQSINHLHSQEMCLDSESINKSLKKSILMNKYKKRNRTYTGSLFEEEQELKATKVIEEYQNALTQALNQNQIKPKKIMELSEQLKQYFTNCLDQTKIKVQK